MQATRSPFARTNVAFLILALLLLGATTPCSAWNLEGHKRITANALSVLPEPLASKLEPLRATLIAGSWAPDTIEKRPQEHSLNPDGSGHADENLDKYARIAEDALRQSPPKWDRAARFMAYAAHFVQDLNNPHHTDKGEGKGHYAYEDIALVPDWPRPGTADGYDGFDAYKTYRALSRATASRARGQFNKIRSGPYGSRSDELVIGTTWNDAVNDTVDLWLSIARNAQVEFPPPSALPEPVRLHKGYCLIEVLTAF